MIKIKILNENALMPKKQRKGDAGFDLYSPQDGLIKPGWHLQIKLGIAIELPENSYGLIVERSGDAIKHSLLSIGPIIDNNYRGEISAILLNNSGENFYYKKGDRIAQLLVLPLFFDQDIIQTDILNENTERGINAHLSSGR